MFRVEAGPGVGLGHLQRCLSLAAAFEEAGARPAFLVNNDPKAVERVRADGWPVATIDATPSWSADDAQKLIAEASSARAQVVVVDSDHDSAAYHRPLRDAGLFVVAVDDLESGEVVADLLLNGDAHGDQLSYRAASTTEFLLGAAYAPVRPPFWEVQAGPPRVPAQSLLLTLGGSDPCQLLPGLIREVRTLTPALHIDVVIGPFVGQAEEIESALAELGPHARAHFAPTDMYDLIEGCDVSLTGAGQTLYELSALGRPAVAIQVAANQQQQLAAFVAAGAVLAAGLGTEPGMARRAVELITKLVAQPEQLRQMAAAGRRFIDGQGARRAARAVLAAVGRRFMVNAR